MNHDKLSKPSIDQDKQKIQEVSDINDSVIDTIINDLYLPNTAEITVK